VFYSFYIIVIVVAVHCTIVVCRAFLDNNQGSCNEALDQSEVPLIATYMRGWYYSTENQIEIIFRMK